MKIKTNKRIQKLVDTRAGLTITRLTVMHVVAGGELNDTAGPEAHQNGVEDGLALATAFQKAYAKHGRTVPKDFGIYKAFQPTGDGDDVLYFIGTVDQIVGKLKAVPESDPAEDDA